MVEVISIFGIYYAGFVLGTISSVLLLGYIIQWDKQTLIKRLIAAFLFFSLFYVGTVIGAFSGFSSVKDAPGNPGAIFLLPFVMIIGGVLGGSIGAILFLAMFLRLKVALKLLHIDISL